MEEILMLMFVLTTNVSCQLHATTLKGGCCCDLSYVGIRLRWRSHWERVNHYRCILSNFLSTCYRYIYFIFAIHFSGSYSDFSILSSSTRAHKYHFTVKF